MADAQTDLHLLVWRLKNLEEQVRELRADINEQFRLQQAMSDAVIHQVREQLREDYLTKDAIRTQFVSRDEIVHRQDLRRQWPIIIATCAAATAAIVQAIELIFLK